MNQRGVSLIEGLLAIGIITGVAISLSFSFSTANKTLLQSRQSAEALRLGDAYLANMKTQPYDYLQTTSTNCSAVNLSDPTQAKAMTTDAGTAFRIAPCVDYVSQSGSTWTPQSTDTGYKRLMVGVSWPQGSQTKFVKEESSITRY